MPFINFSTNNNMEKEAKSKLFKKTGELIVILPNKVEERLMLKIEDEADMYFRGKGDPCMMIQVFLYKESPMEAKSEFADKLVKAASEASGVPASEIFLSFAEYPNWVVNGILK